MILYLDASAAVKRYVAEQGSAEIRQAIASAIVVGMVIIRFPTTRLSVRDGENPDGKRDGEAIWLLCTAGAGNCGHW